jgi:hypothetical protein
MESVFKLPSHKQMFKKLLIGETILDKAAKKEASTLQQDPSKRVNLKLKNSPGHNTHTTCITVSNKTWTLSMIFSKPKTSVSRILRQKDQLPLLLS